MIPTAAPLVSYVMPVYNGERTLTEALESVLRQPDASAAEVLVVEDGSTDGSAALLCPYESAGRIHVLAGPGRGGAAALNLGLRAARGPLVAQIDQDMVLPPDWWPVMHRCLAATPRCGAVQGYFRADPRDGFWARLYDVDLRQRYRRLDPRHVDHVCTGNTLYRREALLHIGGFDDSLGYGYDNDASYRLGAAGWRLAHCPQVRSVHRRRPGLRAYLEQQYGVGYGRLDLIRRHPRRLFGDHVSDWRMILHAAGAGLALASFGASTAWPPTLGIAASVLGALAVERLVAGAKAALLHGEIGALAFPLAHLLRDLAWALATFHWVYRNAAGTDPRPAHSMRRSPA